ncbi:MAG TPA: hypothetical protein VGQ85_02010 [Candidatus Limnocylindrales bacterium]|nr:hypothetical protein [Candidatus Limnocylindrales bacterium]
MSPTPEPRRRGVSLAAALRSLAAIVLLAGCSSLVEARPTPTPLDFGGIQGTLAHAGIALTNTVSGDTGCTDPSLIPTAIGFDASGLGVTTPVRLRIYIFTDRAAWQRRRADVDTCIAAWATDPATIETIGQSPYVVAGQGPWPAAFKTGIAAALKEAAGNGD